MGVKVDVRYVVDNDSVKGLKRDPAVVEYIRRGGEDFATHLRQVAPKHTGAGAASIAAHDSRAAGATDVGWDAAHFYLIFPEYGTKYQAEQRFARDLLYDGYIFE